MEKERSENGEKMSDVDSAQQETPTTEVFPSVQTSTAAEQQQPDRTATLETSPDDSNTTTATVNSAEGNEQISERETNEAEGAAEGAEGSDRASAAEEDSDESDDEDEDAREPLAVPPEVEMNELQVDALRESLSRLGRSADGHCHVMLECNLTVRRRPEERLKATTRCRWAGDVLLPTANACPISLNYAFLYRTFADRAWL
jgi:hypothetical protein